MARPTLGIWLLFTFLTVSPFWLAHAQTGAEKEKMSDANAYLEAVTKANEVPVDQQMEIWRTFLSEHPNTGFRDEIEGNLRRLDELMAKTDPVRKREQKDSERYLKAVEFSKRLSAEDQIALWEQFLEENPKSIYRREARTRLEQLRGASGTYRKPIEPSPAPTVERLTPNLPFKDSGTAILLATFPGLVVPGIGNWYAHDYVTAGILTGFRVGGLGVGIPGIIQGNRAMIVAGAIIVGFTYLVDVATAPFAVQRYNDDLEEKAKIKPVSKWDTPAPFHKGAELMVSFNF